MIRCLVLLIVVSMLIGCATTPDSALQPVARATALDAAVINAVLADLLADKNAYDFATPGKTTILLSPTTAGPIYETQMDADLSSGKWSIPPAIREDVLRRNTAKASLKHLKFGAHVDVQDISKLGPIYSPYGIPEDKFPKAKGYAGLHLPGYSKDGTQAVVLLGFGPTFHGAAATYLLVLKNGKWVVKRRSISFYA